MQRKLILDPQPEAVTEIRNRLLAFNLQYIEDKDPHDFIIRYESDLGKFMAGICFSIHGEWFEVDFLVVEDDERTQGLGSKLLQDAEALAVEKGCTMAFLTTFGFQAKPFYEKQGYQVVYEQKGYPRTGCKYFMEKRLGDYAHIDERD